MRTRLYWMNFAVVSFEGEENDCHFQLLPDSAFDSKVPAPVLISFENQFVLKLILRNLWEHPFGGKAQSCLKNHLERYLDTFQNDSALLPVCELGFTPKP